MQKKPSIFASLARMAAGFVFGLMGFQLYAEQSFAGYGQAMVFAAFLALGARWSLLGVMGLVAPIPPRKKTYAAVVALVMVLMAAGPSLSKAYLTASEPKAWSGVVGAKDADSWLKLYRNKIPEPFRRAEFLSRESEAICSDALREKNFVKLRHQAELAFKTSPIKYDDQARKTISQAYNELFQAGLKALKPTKLADPKMSQAFQKVLQALGSNPTRSLYFHFESKGGLAKTPQDGPFLASLSDPKAAKLPILEVGGAFDAGAQTRRSSNVQNVIQESLNAVWPKDLIQLQAAAATASADDVHFWVQAQVHRIPGFYINSENNVMNALIYKCEVSWHFRIVSAGKELGSFDFRSEPAKHVSYSTQKEDPKWAPYSIVMDSAADSFGRLIVGRLGLNPPAPREHYKFSKS